MSEKHRMLYPPIDGSDNDASSSHRRSATAAMGLPVEPPPTYEAAVSSPRSTNTDEKWAPSASATNSFEVHVHDPHPILHQPNFMPALPVIVEQPPRNQQANPQQPHQQQYQPQSQVLQQSTTVPTITSQTPNLGPDPCKVTCPACGARKTTRMSYTPNSRTHLCALLLCLVGWCCCACCVPYCMKSCRTGNHYCAKCNTFLGTFTPPKCPC